MQNVFRKYKVLPWNYTNICSNIHQIPMETTWLKNDVAIVFKNMLSNI